jgi:hypothetical protein
MFVTAGTSVTVNVQSRSDPASVGNSLMTVDLTGNAGVVASQIAIVNAEVLKNNWLWLEITNVVGAPTAVNVTVAARVHL